MGVIFNQPVTIIHFENITVIYVSTYDTKCHLISEIVTRLDSARNLSKLHLSLMIFQMHIRNLNLKPYEAFYLRNPEKLKFYF